MEVIENISNRSWSTKNLKNTKKIILNWTKLTFLFFDQLSCLTYYVYESSNAVQKRIINYGKKEYKKCLQTVVPCHNAYFPYIIFLSYIVVRFLYAILHKCLWLLNWFFFLTSSMIAFYCLDKRLLLKLFVKVFESERDVEILKMR